jgi:hypothetical protein
VLARPVRASGGLGEPDVMRIGGSAASSQVPDTSAIVIVWLKAPSSIA